MQYPYENVDDWVSEEEVSEIDELSDQWVSKIATANECDDSQLNENSYWDCPIWYRSDDLVVRYTDRGFAVFLKDYILDVESFPNYEGVGHVRLVNLRKNNTCVFIYKELLDPNLYLDISDNNEIFPTSRLKSEYMVQRLLNLTPFI